MDLSFFLSPALSSSSMSWCCCWCRWRAENSLRLLYKRALGITIATSGRMTALVARTGRHQQRYEHGHRLVAGCIPYRYRPTGDGKSMEVLMISSQRGEGLLFPKGGWETDETVEEAACREALEEAGVKGHLQGMLGTWDFKSKRQQGVFCPEGLCRAYMFALDVTEQLETWPEQHARQRQWFAVPDAIVQCRHDWMRGALDQCVAFLASGSSSTSNPMLLSDTSLSLEH
ncbi:nudix hydrolase 16, mitochondrial-like isoform X5 [Physcomitrium patens]|uniref:Nudix hydrolase domain-containing protein n=1 Tax=Physcomitrium patens TaxID=3218 RepID=A0A7I4FSY8_PHYPA|nr:nudix hydrolase 16, mitochondrial-like isoform X4 [Physcomitrium patens]|eukprot:XP_024381617.1 nudix hydrolase 16, mitochondrial-like isoform X4 [Physcomitrella patens]